MNKREINAALEACAKGDEAAFEKLYREMRGGVYSFVYTYFQNSFDAEDVMQTTFLKIKLNADKYAVGTNGLAWILQIAKNTALNELEKRKTASRYECCAMGEFKVASDDFDSAVTDVMDRVLDEDERRIVVLHVVWGYKHREIAEFLRVPTGTVTSKYKRSVEKIKRELEKEV